MKRREEFTSQGYTLESENRWLLCFRKEKIIKIISKLHTSEFDFDFLHHNQPEDLEIREINNAALAIYTSQSDNRIPETWLIFARETIRKIEEKYNPKNCDKNQMQQ